MAFSDKYKSRKKDEVREWKLRPEILVGPRIPPPMHGLCPRIIMGTKWWNRTRKEAYKTTNQHCIACGVSRYEAASRQWLEGHELYEIDYLIGYLTYVETVPLCHYCHNFIHRGRLAVLLSRGKIHHQKYAAIIVHGERLLKQHNLQEPDPYTGPQANWDDWRLSLDGKDYPPLYNRQEWFNKFGRGDSDE